MVDLDSPSPGSTRGGNPKRALYAMVDAAGEVLTAEKRVHLRGEAERVSLLLN